MKPVIVVTIAVGILVGACAVRTERTVVEQRPATVAVPSTVVVPADPPASATVIVPAR